MKLSVVLSLPATDHTVPLIRTVEAGQSTWKFESQLQDGELYYRTKLSGTFTLSGEDFAWLYDRWQEFACCVEVSVNVFTPACEGEGDTLLWPGYFPLSAAKFDFTTCKATVREVLPRDGYDALYRVWNKPINLMAQSSAGGNIIRESFVAVYPNYYTYQPDPATGTNKQTLPDGNVPGTGPSSQEHTYGHGLPLLAVLTKLMIDTVTGSGASPMATIVQTDFYASAIDPVTARPIYSRGIMAASDAKRPASVTPATKLIISLKEFLDELKAIHNVWHCIDPATSRLRLEHYSWFAERSYQQLGKISLNLTKFPDALEKANNESIDVDSLYGVEEIVIENNNGSTIREFRSGSVRYDDVCVIKDDKGEFRTNTLTASKFFTDLDAAYKNPESVPDSAIFFYELQPAHTTVNLSSNLPELANSIRYVQYKDYLGAVGIGNNGYLAAAVLFIDYHRVGRSYTSGIVNSVRQEDGSYSAGMRMGMNSTLPTRRQEGIAIPVCCADLPINLSGYIKTNRFEKGQLGKAVFDPATETITLDVVTRSRCQESMAVVEPPDPGDDCAPKGTYLDTVTEIAYCSDGVTEMSRATIYIYADGNCGTYEQSGGSQGVGGC